MKYAETVRDMLNAFTPRPLFGEDLKKFYYADTMAVRTGDSPTSPIQDIWEGCHEPSERSAYLLLGHSGCGKSTELNEMSVRLRDDGYLVRTVQCGADLDLLNPAYEDLLILMGEALLEMAEEVHCGPDRAAEETIRGFWTDVERERTVTREAGAEIGVGGSAEMNNEPAHKVLHLPLLRLFLDAKADLKYNEETRTICREHISRRISGWLAAMNRIAEQITDRLDGRQPVIIFEDLDKLERKEAWNVFLNHSKKLTGLTFPVIYTFPIALSYDSHFRALEGQFEVEVFPMIKLTDVDDTPCQEGIATIREIVRMRSDMSLFEDAALNYMIDRTGGSLRDLFRAIVTGARRARRRNDTKLRMEDAERALEEQKSMLTRRIEKKDYAFLAKICAKDCKSAAEIVNRRTEIEEKEALLDMLRVGVVLEYNGKRWHNVHPLVADFLKMQGLIDNG